MQRRRIGDLDVPVLALGTAVAAEQLDRGEVTSLVSAAVDLGVTWFDTAPTHAGGTAEEHVGRAVGNRDDVVVATRLAPVDRSRLDPPPPGSVAHIRDSVDASLYRLGRDWIDLYLLDRPHPGTPIEDSLGALGDLVVAGKVRELGGAGLDPSVMGELTEAADELDLVPLRAVRERYSPAHRRPDDELIAACTELGWSLIAARTPDDDLAEPDPGSGPAPRLAAYARSRDRSPLELSLSWTVRRPAVVGVVIDVTSADELASAVAALDWDLTADEAAEIDEITSKADVAGRRT